MDKIVPRAQQGVIVTEDDSPYYSVVTNIGREKIAQALKTGTPLEIKEIALGDANGSSVLPDRTATKLVHEVWRGECVTMLDPSNPSTVLAKTNVPITVGGWMVYEIAVIDKDGDIIIHANAPGWIKLAVVNGMSNPMEIVMRLSVVDADAIHLSISYDGVNLTFKDLDDHNKDQTAHMGHFQDMKLHVSEDDRENWDNPLLVATVNLNKSGWSRDPDGVTYIQDVTAQLPPETVLANMDLAIKADPNLIAQMVDGNIGLVAEQSKGKIIFHALREIPGISMYAQVSLYRSKSGEAKTYYSNPIGMPGKSGSVLPNPIDKSSIRLENQSTRAQLKIHGTHTNPTYDWDATRIVRGEDRVPVGPTDGVQVADGKITSFDDTNGLRAGVRYIYAYFPRNAAGNYQMSATTAEITIPAQKPLAPTNLQVRQEEKTAALTWQAQSDIYRDNFIVVRKEGSEPSVLTDGEQVYQGKEMACTDNQSLEFGRTYYWRVFAVNALREASDNSPSVSLTPQPTKPGQVTSLSATDVSSPEEGYRVLVRFSKPQDATIARVIVVRKEGTVPTTWSDGNQVHDGLDESFYDTPPYSQQAYYYRAFTANSTGQVNDSQEGATASVTLTAKEPGAVTNLVATDEKGTTTGSFDLPVVMVEGREAVNRFVTGYVVIQKEGGVPASERDGEVIASAEIDPRITNKSVNFVKYNQKDGATFYITVFLKNAAGRYGGNNGVYTYVTPKIIPDEPTGWSEIKTDYSSGSFTFPETGYFKIVVAGGGGKGGNGDYQGPNIGDGGNDGKNKASGGGGGGCGGFAESKYLKRKGETISYTVGSTVTCEGMRATSGGNGSGRSGGSAGSASGGNLRNVQGAKGEMGQYDSDRAGMSVSASGGSGARNEHSYGGSGGSASGVNSSGTERPGSPGSRPCVKIYRGNTNLTLSELNAWEIANLKSENENAATILSKLTVDTDYRLLMLEFGNQAQY